MNQQIDYRSLMHTRSEVGTAPTRFWRHSDGCKPELLNDGWFSFLFVLQGELICVFNGGYTTKLTAPQMMVVDKHQLRELRCVGDTVILEFVESDKMTPLTQSISKIFKIPYFEGVTLNNKLKAWCQTMFTDLTDNPSRHNDYYYDRCCELTTLLLEYPQSVLGTLYIPLYACSNHCENCTKLFVRNEEV